MERAAMRAGLRPWEIDRASPDDLYRWVEAHYGDGRVSDLPIPQKAEEVMRRLRGERR